MRTPWRATALWLVAVCLLITQVSTAARQRPYVTVVLSQRGGVYTELVAGIRTGLSESGAQLEGIRFLSAAELSEGGKRLTTDAAVNLVVTAGSQAALAVMALERDAPVYCTLIPHLTYQTIVEKRRDPQRSERRPVSAMYLDQPLERQFRLIRLAFPVSQRVAVVLGPESRAYRAQLSKAAEANDLALRVEEIDNEKSLPQALYKVMVDADVLLAIPDPLVFNRHTVQNILLTSYRLRKPVVGYSEAYVNAGATIGMYSTLEQISRQVAEDITQISMQADLRLPPPRFPRYYKVDVNRRVADSLGLTIDDNVIIERRLVETTGTSRR